MRGLTISLLLAVVIAGYATASPAQQQQAGVSAAVRGQVALARPSANIVGRQVESGDPIYLGDAITSGRDSGLQIMLMDETVFSIGPNSEIAIDEFVYDPSTDSGKVTASVAKGVFRFITGKIAQKRPEDMTVRLPTATIGIRGTIVAGAVRSEAGSDPVVDAVFNGLKGAVPDAENGNDFVVLLGPGHENNTNERGGAFVFTPNPPQRAESESGLNAGAAPPGGFGFGQGLNPGVVISRTGKAVVGFVSGAISDIFDAPAVSTAAVGNATTTQPQSGPNGSPNDPDAQETNNTPATQAEVISGETIAEATGDAATQAGLTQVTDSGGEVSDPTATAGGNSIITTLSEVTAITTGNNQYSIPSTSISGDVSGSYSGTVFLDFGTQQFIVNVSGSYSGVIAASFTLNSTETFQEASTNGLMAGFFDSAVDSELSVTPSVGNNRVIAAGVFLNDANGTAGSLAHSVTVIHETSSSGSVVVGTGAALTPKN